jgi:poly-gamma-glutamate capsule biosynthesis protein CapA/YwtB (metallophosphatase superfamily)
MPPLYDRIIAPERSPLFSRGVVAGLLLVAVCGLSTRAAGDLGTIEAPVTVQSPATRVDPPPRRVTVLAGGDVLTESRVRASAAAAGARTGQRFDFEPMFAELRPVIESADLAICNMEIPIGAAGGPYGYAGRSPYGGNLLLAPYEIASGLRSAGFDRCSTASNHAYDTGTAGVVSTIEALHTHGISTVGTARSSAEAVDQIFTVQGVDIAHLSYATYSNTVRPTAGWLMNYTRNPAVVASAVGRARASGAEIVLVSLHLSRELATFPAADDRALVTQLVALADVDAVFLHGPHVVQPFEMVGGTPVWWSLGNFVSEMSPPSVGRYSSPRTSDGLLAYVEFTEAPSGRYTARPMSVAICNDFLDRTVRSATVALTRQDLPDRIRSELSACLGRTRGLVPNVL